MPDYPFANPPAPATLFCVAPGVCWLRMPLPFVLDHINLWVLDDGDAVTLVDTGLASKTIRAVWTDVLALIGKPVRRILVTHFHPDHLGNAAWLARETGAPVLMSAGEYLSSLAVWHQIGGHAVADMVDFFRANGLPEDRCQPFVERGNAYKVGIPELPGTYERLLDGDTLRIGDHDWRLDVGHGHSPEHVGLYCASLGVLISGDMLLPRITTNISVFAVTPTIDAVRQFLDSLDAWRALPEDTLVLPAHGLPFRGLHARINDLFAHHAARLEELEAALTQPFTAAELMPVLFERPLDTHQTMFAMGETIAHLNYLEHAGRATRQTDNSGTIRFQRKNPNR